MTEKEVLDLVRSGEEFTIEVKNFTKYNPDCTKDWIKLHHDWLQDPVLMRLSPTSRLLFITLCSLRGNKGEPLGNLTGTSLGLLTNLRGTSMELLVATLWKHGLIFVDKKRVDKKRVSKKRIVSAEVKTAPANSQIHPAFLTHGASELVRRSELPLKSQQRHLEHYRDEDFVRGEFMKMLNWLDANPQKVPKSKSGWNRFVSGWLARSWERYRTSPAPPKPPPKIDHDALWGVK